MHGVYLITPSDNAPAVPPSGSEHPSGEIDDHVVESGRPPSRQRTSQPANRVAGTSPTHALIGFLASLPRGAAAVAASALVSGIVAYYLPQLLSTAPTPTPPLAADVLDNIEPPITMVVPSAQTGIGSPGSGCASFRRWATAIGGIDAGTTTFTLVLQSTTNAATYVAGVRAHILATRPPSSGIAVSCPAQAGVVERSVLINLDSGVGTYVRAGRGAPFGFTLRRGESEIFNISAATTRHALQWTLEVDAVINGMHHILTVRDNKRAFMTSAVDSSRAIYRWNYTNAWELDRGGSREPVRVVPVGKQLTPVGRLRGGSR
jgi:hypothetical protein